MPKKFTRKISGDKIDLIRKHFEEEGKKPAEIAILVGERTHIVVAAITHYKMKVKTTIPFPPETKDLVALVCGALKKGKTVQQLSVAFGMSPENLRLYLSRSPKLTDGDRKKIRTAKNQGKKYLENLLKKRIATLCKKGYCKKEAAAILGIPGDKINKVAGDIDFEENTLKKLRLRNRKEPIPKDKIAEEYRTGLVTASELSRKYGIGVSTVCYIIREAGMEVTHILANGEPEGLRKYAEILHLRDLGWTIKQIAEFQNTNVKSVSGRLSRWNALVRKSKIICEAEVNRRKVPEVYREIFRLMGEGVRQAEIALRVGFSPQYINHIVKGRMIPSGKREQ